MPVPAFPPARIRRRPRTRGAARPAAGASPTPGRAVRAVGVDLGGTWLRVLAEDGRGRRRAHREPAVPLPSLPARLRALWRRWGIRPRAAVLVVASRGVWTAAERQDAARRLRGLARRALVIADVEAALLGALGDRPGILLLAGTGSIALGRDARGRWARAGGLGPLLGDEGSAFWIGREWLKRAGDRAQARALALARRPDATARLAALAPRVLRRARRRAEPGTRRAGGAPAAGAAARTIVAEAERHLAGLVASAARRLRLTEPVATSWAGGLLSDRRVRHGVWRRVRGLGLRIRPVRPRSTAAGAALRLAQGLAGIAPRQLPPTLRGVLIR